MGKKVFDRIWKTVMIIVNTAFNFLSIALAFCTLINGRLEDCDGWLMGIIIIAAVNILNYVTRRYFKNY